MYLVYGRVHLNHSIFTDTNKLVNMRKWYTIKTNSLAQLTRNAWKWYWWITWIQRCKNYSCTTSDYKWEIHLLLWNFSLLYGASQSYESQFFTGINYKGQIRTEYQHDNTENYNHHVDTCIRFLSINYASINIVLENMYVGCYQKVAF